VDMAQYAKYKEGGLRQKIHKAIRAKQCIRCWSADHLRSSCPEPPKKWEDDYNKGKDAFWAPKLPQSRPQWISPTFARTAPRFVSSLLLARDAHLVLALDTCSDVSIGQIEFLENVRLVEKGILVEGCGGRILFEMEGELSLVGKLEITVFAVKKGDLPPNTHALLGNLHLKQLCVSLDFVQNHPYCRLEDAIEYGRTLVFPRTFLLPTTPALAVTSQSGEESDRSLWMCCCGIFCLMVLALALSPQLPLCLTSLAHLMEPQALIWALIVLLFSRLVWLTPGSGLTVFSSLDRPRVGTKTVLPFPPPMETRPCTISPSLSPVERARFESACSEFSHLFTHNTTAQHQLGGRSPRELVYGGVHPMRVSADCSYPGEGASVFFNPQETRRVPTPSRTHSPKSRPPLKRRLESFAKRWCQPQAVLFTNSGYRRRRTRYARRREQPAKQFATGWDQLSQAYPLQQPYGQHSVSVPDKIRLLSLARSVDSSQALSSLPARRCYMMSIVRDEGGSSAVEPYTVALVPRPEWMRMTPPFVNDEDADDTWREGTSRLFGSLPPLEPSSFTEGNTLKATVEIQHPYTGKHQARVALDTQSDVTTCLREYLVDVHAIVPDVVDGCGGSAQFTEEGTLFVFSHHERNSVMVPALVALPHQLPSDCVALLGVPALLALEVAIEQHLKLPQFSTLQCHLGEKKLREWLEHHPTDSVDQSPFDLNSIQINPALTNAQIRRVLELIRRCGTVFEGHQNSLPKPFAAEPITLKFKQDAKPQSIPQPR
jgi:hypothetical protein